MKFYLIIYWRCNMPFCRIFTGGQEALMNEMARAFNGVVVEINNDDISLIPKIYVDVHDYEYRDNTGRPAPINWDTNLAFNFVFRVGRDIPRKDYKGCFDG